MLLGSSVSMGEKKFSIHVSVKLQSTVEREDFQTNLIFLP